MQIMGALSQPTRFKVYQLLIDQLPDGLAAGDLGEATKMLPSAISAHLAVLARAGLVKSKKVGRNVIYRADTARGRQLVDYLDAAIPNADAASSKET